MKYDITTQYYTKSKSGQSEFDYQFLTSSNKKAVLSQGTTMRCGSLAKQACT